MVQVSKKQILIIDSDPLAQESLRDLFDGEYRVLQASSHAEALTHLNSSTSIGAVILAINDRFNDSEFLQSFRDCVPHTPLVIHLGCPGGEGNHNFPEFLQPYKVVCKSEAANGLQEALDSMLTDDID